MKVPESFWEEAESTFNVIFGAAIGGYFGVVFASANADTVNMLSVFASIVMIALFALMLVTAGRRFSKGDWLFAAVNFLMALGIFGLGQLIWSKLPINLTILNAILIGWISVYLWEFASSIPTLMKQSKKND